MFIIDGLSTIILFLFVFCLIVVSHEFGHFLLARVNGVRVKEFTVGMGPKLIGWHRNGTDFAIRLLPIGGACIYDLEDEEEVLEENGSIREKAKGDIADKDIADKAGSDDGFLDEKAGIPYGKASVMKKISIVIAGPLFNFILAYILAIVVTWFCGSTVPVINGLIEGYPAEEAGIEPGDVIVSMNGSPVYLATEIYVNTYINKERPMNIEFMRDGELHSVTVNPKYDEELDRYLIGFNGYGEYIDCKNSGIFKQAYYEFRYGVVGTYKSLIMLLEGRGSKDDLAGPIGMAQTVDTIKDESIPYGFGALMLNMLNLAMILSVNLGILNLLPLPAIDGGKLVLLIIEAVRGKPISPEKEGLINLIGFALLMVLMVFVMYNDIIRWITTG